MRNRPPRPCRSCAVFVLGFVSLNTFSHFRQNSTKTISKLLKLISKIFLIPQQKLLRWGSPLCPPPLLVSSQGQVAPELHKLRGSSSQMLSRSLSRYQAVAPAAAARLSTAVRAATAGGQAAADALNAPLSATDPELFDIIEHEKLRQARSPRLTLSRALIYQQTPRAHTSHLRNPGRRQLVRRALRLVRISLLEAVAGRTCTYVHLACACRAPTSHAHPVPHAHSATRWC